MSKHRVLIIGVGSIGERHLRCFVKTGRVQAALCETNEALRTTVAERCHVDSRNVYRDLDAAMEATHDAAVVAVPAHLHIAMTKRLVEAGVAVLCEKPLSTSLDGVDELIQLAADQSVATP